MKARLLLSSLLLAFILLALWLLGLDQSPRESGEIPRLSQVAAGSIDRIRILRKNAEALSFARQEEEWRMQSPENFRARQSRIDALLGILSSRSFFQIDANEANLKLFQLAPPEVSLLLNDLRFDFGSTEPIDERRYVMTGNIIHLVNDSLYHQLRQASSFYASDRLIAGNEQITSIDFKALSPAQLEEDSEQGVSALAPAWQNARAGKVNSYQRSDGFSGATIKVKFSSGHSAVFDVLSSDPLLVLGRADIGLQYSLNKEQTNKLLPGQK